MGYSCIDNLPAGLLPTLIDRILREAHQDERKIAVSIDARNLPSDLQTFPDVVLALDRRDLDCEIVYLDASSPSLVKRFSETRRRHPLTNDHTGLREALEHESELLEHIADLADLTIDTTRLSPQQLSELIRERVVDRNAPGMSLLFVSFGFKRGVPVDADMVFDARCLPNPHWIPTLRILTGRDKPVQEYLAAQEEVSAMQSDIVSYLERWLPKFEANSRSYMTVAIGCTGGQHRSVYLAEMIGAEFRKQQGNVLIRHRELEKAKEVSVTTQVT